METFHATLHTCGCGYKTLNHGNAFKHRNSKCKHTMTIESKEFILKEDHLRSINIDGNHNNVNSNNVTNNVTINLVVPNNSPVGAIYEAVQNQECLDELKAADPHQIPAIFFKYTRGSKTEQPVVRYDPHKDAVNLVDSVTGVEVSRDLKKYRNDYLTEQAEVYDETYHLQYLPDAAKKSMKELTKPTFSTGKKKDAPIPAADVIKMCAAGDYRMYKLPFVTKKFFNDVAKDVDNEIKQTYNSNN